MASPDTVEKQAPNGSFELVTSIIDHFEGHLGNQRTRRTVAAHPVLPRDLEFGSDNRPIHWRDGISSVWDHLEIIRHASPLSDERFAVVQLQDWPPNLDSQTVGRHVFVLSDRLRVIDLRSFDGMHPEKEKGSPPIEEIFNQINIAIRLQPKLKTSAN